MTRLRVDVDFDALERCISDAIVTLTPEGRVSAWSAAAADVTGIARADALERTLDELFAHVDPPLGFAVVPSVLRCWTNDERRRTLHATVLSVDGGWLLSFGAQQRFDAIDRLKREIVSSVSHELKTPIASIKAFATTLRENPENTAAQRAEYLATIEHEADRLTVAVEQLLSAARVEPEHLLARRERVRLAALIDRALARVPAHALARIERRVEEIEVNVDPELLAEAIANLVDNALKYSAEDSTVELAAATDAGTIEIRIRDHGIGIAAEHLPYIFERFYRSERSLSASTSGYGLGLFVAREIARAHGGTLEVASAPHAGSTFTIRLPERR